MSGLLRGVVDEIATNQTLPGYAGVAISRIRTRLVARSAGTGRCPGGRRV